MENEDDFVLVCQSVVGNSDYGFTISYGWDGLRHKSLKEAQADGWEQRQSDDFNVAILHGEVVLDFLTSDGVPMDYSSAVAFAEQNDLRVGTR